MAQPFTVQVRGLRELNRALKQVENGLDREVKEGLKRAAEPIAAEAGRRLSRFTGVGPFKPAVTTKAVFVRQSRSKVTGLRGDFGALQMAEGLIPAAWDHADDIERELENVLDHLTRRAGF